MAPVRYRHLCLLALALTAGCASATDRLNEGVQLQAQGRYMEAVYRYAEAVERDPELLEARDRLVAAGDTAIMVAMDNADDLERRGDPVAAAGLYRDVDRMLARVREVGMRLEPPSDYALIRRAIFDTAIDWQMVRGDEAAEQGRWSEARRYYVGARTESFLPSRSQVEESLDAEVGVLLDWAEIELTDGHPRAAHTLAQEALEVRTSPARDVVLRVREVQERALEAGTVVIAVLPVTAEPGVREYLGGEFEIELDDDLALDHWNQPPLFVEIADPIILRRELRGLLRGQATQSPIIVGRALELIGADLGVMVQLSAIEVVEADVDSDTRQVIVPRPANSNQGRGLGRGRGEARGLEEGQGRGRGRGLAEEGEQAEEPQEQPMDTLTYTTLEGDLSYALEADVILVDGTGREIERFTAFSERTGPFQRGEFDGDPRRLELDARDRPFFDPSVLAGQVGEIEGAILEQLSVAIASGTYEAVLSGVR